MNLMFSRSLEGYMHEPSQNDGVTILHIDPKDADILESILLQYGFETNRLVPNDLTIVKNGVTNEPVDLWGTPVEESPKKRKKKKSST